jgi:hypothetical protein
MGARAHATNALRRHYQRGLCVKQTQFAGSRSQGSRVSGLPPRGSWASAPNKANWSGAIWRTSAVQTKSYDTRDVGAALENKPNFRVTAARGRGTATPNAVDRVWEPSSALGQSQDRSKRPLERRRRKEAVQGRSSLERFHPGVGPPNAIFRVWEPLAAVGTHVPCGGQEAAHGRKDLDRP